MPGTHAKLSASGSKKWLNCPGSVKLESTMPNESSSYATEGTTAHSLGEEKIRLALKETTRVKYHKSIQELQIDADMENYAEEYKNYVIERFNAAKSSTTDAVLMIEQRLDFSDFVPEGFGIGDCIIIADGNMEIIDLKYGKGIPVYASDNSQLKLYALGAIAEFEYLYDINKITMTIFQPRLDNIDSATITVFELLTWGEGIKEKAKQAFNGSDEFCAGKHCDEGFCKARPFCRAYADRCIEAAKFDFMRPAELSTEEVAEVIELSEKLSKWAVLVKDYALDQALHHNVKYPGYKLVEGRSVRKFGQPDEKIADVITQAGYEENDVWSRKLKGLGDLEKLLSKKTFNEILGKYIMKPVGTPTLVPIEDKRAELNTEAKAAEDFKEYIEN